MSWNRIFVLFPSSLSLALLITSGLTSCILVTGSGEAWKVSASGFGTESGIPATSPQ